MSLIKSLRSVAPSIHFTAPKTLPLYKCSRDERAARSLGPLRNALSVSAAARRRGRLHKEPSLPTLRCLS